MTVCCRRNALPVLVAFLTVACSSDPIVSEPAAEAGTATTTQVTTELTTEDAEPSERSTSESTVVDATTTSPTTSPTDPLLLSTDLGPIRGTNATLEGVRAFLGVPFAEPPVGDLRFAPPVTRTAWTDEFDAATPGAACPQLAVGVTAQFLVTPDWEDDCLSLSVWSPDGATDLPVMVWFHGGSLVTGSAHQPFFIGDNLAAKGAVVVNVNYRLGALGYLDGNWGLLDQVEALDWVQRNIASFGGDPEAVTIFGESAGGFSVCALLAASPAPEFAQAIIQSGSGCHRLQPAPDAAAATQAFLAATACTDLECARSLPTDELLTIPFDPTLIADGETLTRSAYDLALDRELPGRPIMTGFNADEATLFTIGLSIADDSELTALVAEFTDDPPAVLALYPADQFEGPTSRYLTMWTDAVFACPALAFAGATRDTFVYEFTYVSPSTPFDLGATHGAELAYVFGHPEGLTLLDEDRSDADQAVADRMQQIWVDFATTGSPGWDRYDATTGGVMDIGVDNAFVDTVRSDRCDDLNAIIGS